MRKKVLVLVSALMLSVSVYAGGIVSSSENGFGSSSLNDGNEGMKQEVSTPYKSIITIKGKAKCPNATPTKCPKATK